MHDTIGFKAKLKFEHWRAGELLQEFEFPNGVTNGGRDSALNVLFHNSSQISTWYISLINGSGTPTLNAADVMNNHGGWTEDQNYSEANRVEWAEGAASSQSITSTTTSVFTINGTTSLYGGFITSDNTKGGTSGTLWATGAFTIGTINVVATDVIKITYTVTD